MKKEVRVEVNIKVRESEKAKMKERVHGKPKKRAKAGRKVNLKLVQNHSQSVPDQTKSKNMFTFTVLPMIIPVNKTALLTKKNYQMMTQCLLVFPVDLR